MKNTGEYTLRFMQKGEEYRVYDLVLNVFHEYVAPTYTPKGIKTFLSTLSVDYFKNGDPKKFTLVAEHDKQIAGMLSNINEGHIALLFVASQYQKRGIGEALIELCSELCLQKFSNLGTLTVSSSPNSLSFYERIGFVALSEEQNESGLKFIPMQKKIRFSSCLDVQ